MPRHLAVLAFVIAVACGDGKERPDYDKTGAIEVIVGFRDSSGTFSTPDPEELRATLHDLGLRVEWTEWPPPVVRDQAIAAIRAMDPDAIRKAEWSGNRIFLRSTRALDDPRLRATLTALDLEVRELRADVDEGLGEHFVTLTIGGVDVRIERALETRWPGTDVVVAESLMVGPRRRP